MVLGTILVTANRAVNQKRRTEALLSTPTDSEYRSDCDHYKWKIGQYVDGFRYRPMGKRR